MRSGVEVGATSGITPTPRAASGVASSASSSIGRSTMSTASTPAARGALGERRRAPSRRSGCSSRTARSASRCRGGAARRPRRARRRAPPPAASARSIARWIDGPSADGSRERHAELDARRRRRGTRPRSIAIDVAGIGIAERQVRDERGAVLGGARDRSARAQASHGVARRVRARDRCHVLVAAAREADDDDRAVADRRDDLVERGDRVRGLERAQDALGAREPLERRRAPRRRCATRTCARRCLASARARARRRDSRGRR